MRQPDKPAERAAGGVEGWLTENEGALLYRLARDCPESAAIVEIGSYRGRSTIRLARGSRAGNRSKIYAVDPHRSEPDNYSLLRKNLTAAGVDDMVVPIRKTSVEAAAGFKAPVGLIFIDGAHEYDPVLADYEAWFPRVIDGGVLAFHDTITPGWGSTRLVRERIYRSRYFRRIGLVDSITYGEKAAAITAKDTIRNRYLLLLNYIYSAALTVPVPSAVRKLGKVIVKKIQ